MAEQLKYRKRVVDSLLAEKLEATGAVLIEGPKACGKTTTAEQQAKSILYMDDPDRMSQNLQLAQTNIKVLLRGETPRLIDEWQIAPQLWDAIRFEVDHRGDDGLFMLTGSAVPADDSKIHHTGTGRFSWLTMRPMTLWESGESTGDVSLGSMFEHPEMVEGESHLSMEGVDALKDLAGKIDTSRMRESSFLMVLTGVGQYAYRREDGVYVVPIGCLKD